MKKCPYPFSQLSIQSTGDVIPCCWLGDYVVGNVFEQPIREIWNSERMQALRGEFVAGEPKICARPIEASHCNYLHSDLDHHIDDRVVQAKPPQRLHLMLNGKCNLECIMCDNWRAPNGFFKDGKFWEREEKEILPYLEEIEVYGGEPFIQADVYALIDRVHAINPGCNWMFTTNAHYHFNDTIRRSLDRLRIKSVSISVDSLDAEVFPQIRLKGSLATLIKGLDAWVEYRDQRAKEGRGFLLVCNTVVQKLNYRELPRIVDEMAARGISTFPYLMNKPHELSLYDLPDAERARIVGEYIAALEQKPRQRLKVFAHQLIKTLPVLQRKQALAQLGF